MNYAFFDQFFYHTDTPVVVCQQDGALAVYQNRQAKLLLNPMDFNPHQNIMTKKIPLSAIFTCDEQTAAEFRQLLDANGSVSNFATTLTSTSGETRNVSISANPLELEGILYTILYIKPQALPINQTSAEALAAALHISHIAESTDDAINQLLEFAGSYTKVSRSYIFESIFPELTSNTYEWCAPGVEPAIDSLQLLPKDDYSYDYIVNNGLAITDDIRQLPEHDRVVLEPQGIKALAIIPIMYHGEPLGYVGFDDCENYRKWPQNEIQMLSDIADMLANLLARRNTERRLHYSLNVMQTVTDNFDTLVFVNNIETHEVLFTNNTMAEMVGIPKEDIVGKDCQILGTNEKGLNHNCHMCPISTFVDEEGPIKNAARTWEVYNLHNHKWYLTRGAIIKWIDGSDAYIETATDITKQKEYEEQLRLSATTDAMTGIYNRIGGRTLIMHMLDNAITSAALAFIDLDGLKSVNDNFGHDLGDEMICCTADILKSSIREHDILCRWGGDEFLIYFSCDKAQADMIMKRIQKYLDAFNASGQKPYPVQFSYGIVTIPIGTGRSLEDIIADADALMYKNKLDNHSSR